MFLEFDRENVKLNFNVANSFYLRSFLYKTPEPKLKHLLYSFESNKTGVSRLSNLIYVSLQF